MQLANLSNPEENKMKSKTDSWKLNFFWKKKWKTKISSVAFLSNLNVYFEQLQAKETSSNSKNGGSGKVRTPKIFKCNCQTYQIQQKTKWNPKQIYKTWTFLKKKVKNENLLSSVFMQFEAISWALTSQRNKVGFQKWR